MKKTFLKFSVIALLGITASAQVVNLDNGWNNIGIINDTPLSDFNNTHIKYVWQYTHGQWKVYSPDNELMQKIRENIQNGCATYGVMSSILNQGSAVWIYTDENLQIRIGEANVYTSVSGVVKDAVTHALIPNFVVTLDNSRTYNETNGTLSLNNVSLGQHLISIHADGYKDTNVSIDLENSTEIKKIKAMINSMTPKERKEPSILLKSNSRKRRIAKGAGLSIQETNKILKQFQNAAKLAKKFANKKSLPNINEIMKQMGNMKFPH
jgi:hypothetical protein